MSMPNDKIILIEKIKMLGTRSEWLHEKAHINDKERAEAIAELEEILKAERQEILEKPTSALLARAYLESRRSPATVAEITAAICRAGLETNEDSVRSLLVRRNKQNKDFYRVSKNMYDLIERKKE